MVSGGWAGVAGGLGPAPCCAVLARRVWEKAAGCDCRCPGCAVLRPAAAQPLIRLDMALVFLQQCLDFRKSHASIPVTSSADCINVISNGQKNKTTFLKERDDCK